MSCSIWDHPYMEASCTREMLCRVTIESPEALTPLWHSYRKALRWTCPFVLPPWLNAWWSVFGHDAESLIAVVRQGKTVIGIAPLMLQGKTVRFLGDPNVCDTFDCVVAHGKESLFFEALFAHLSAQGFNDLDLGPMRPDAAALKFLSAHRLSCRAECRMGPEDVLSEVDLPGTWDAFLDELDGKQRHEIRRKLRRLHEAGSIRFRRADDVAELPEAMETFLRLFSMNREDKAAFMTAPMASFFRALSLALAEDGLLRLFFLDMDERPVASVFCFDHRGTRYLYNNGYDDAYRELSVGLMCKVLSLKAAIDEGLSTYNFLRGGELYKVRLGGREVPLASCHVTLC